VGQGVVNMSNQKRVSSCENRCIPSSDKTLIKGLEEVVQCFIECNRPMADREARFYKIQPNLEKAIEIAALAKMPSGKRCPHQRRIPEIVLEQARDRLLTVSRDLQNSASFQELFDIVEHTIGSIKGIGDLTIYDTAYRIGMYLNLEPEEIYLHAGTRQGAKAIGIDTKNKKFLSVKQLPAPFAVLRPAEIEDCLCIYEEELRKLYGD
jgi:hypothetical protein